MTGLLIAAAAAGYTIFTGAQGVSTADLSPEVAKCISDNAPKVERTIASLNDATTFLTDDLCGAAIAEELARQSKTAMKKLRDDYHAKCLEDQKTAKAAQPSEQGEEEMSACAMDRIYNAYPTDAEAPGLSLLARSDDKMPLATSYAARLLLDLRLAHTKP